MPQMMNNTKNHNPILKIAKYTLVIPLFSLLACQKTNQNISDNNTEVIQNDGNSIDENNKSIEEIDFEKLLEEDIAKDEISLSDNYFLEKYYFTKDDYKSNPQESIEKVKREVGTLIFGEKIFSKGLSPSSWKTIADSWSDYKLVDDGKGGFQPTNPFFNLMKVNKNNPQNIDDFIYKEYSLPNISFSLNNNFQRETNGNNETFTFEKNGLTEAIIRIDYQEVGIEYKDKKIDEIITNVKGFAEENTDIQKQKFGDIKLIDFGFKKIDGLKAIWVQQVSNQVSPSFKTTIETYNLFNYPYIYSITASYPKENEELIKDFLKSIKIDK